MRCRRLELCFARQHASEQRATTRHPRQQSVDDDDRVTNDALRGAARGRRFRGIDANGFKAPRRQQCDSAVHSIMPSVSALRTQRRALSLPLQRFGTILSEVPPCVRSLAPSDASSSIPAIESHAARHHRADRRQRRRVLPAIDRAAASSCRSRCGRSRPPSLGTGVAFMPWQLVTYAFLHGSLLHLAFNMFALYMFGGAIERVFGTRRYLHLLLHVGGVRGDHAADRRGAVGRRDLSDDRRVRRRIRPAARVRHVFPAQPHHAAVSADPDAGARVRRRLRGARAVPRRHRHRRKASRTSRTWAA